MAAAAGGDEILRLQDHLDSVELSQLPRVQLLGAAPSEAADLSEGVAVLDSSFNPPTVAHLSMLRAVAERFGLGHSLLLLAKQNADKPVVGASLVQRLQMMERVAAAEPSGGMLCGVTAHPLFVDKATALGGLCGGGRVCMLVGYDTWVRIVDPKYYPADGGLDAALRVIFEHVEVVVASRDPSSAANLDPLSAAQQEAAVRSLPADLTRSRLHFLTNAPEVGAHSSSAARAAAAAGESGALLAMLPACLHAYVEREGLYREP